MIMMVIAICALLLRIAAWQIIKINISQNESDAYSTLKLIAASLENYAKDNSGAYPANFALLTQNKPAYLDRDYIAQSPFKGYNYICPRLEVSGYNCLAVPLKCKLTGRKVYAINTGGVLGQEECDKKE